MLLCANLLAEYPRLYEIIFCPQPNLGFPCAGLRGYECRIMIVFSTDLSKSTLDLDNV